MPALTLDPSLPLEETEEFPIAQTTGPVVRIRREIHPRSRRRWKLRWDLLSIDEKNTVVALFREVRGRAGRFEFTPPGEEDAVECRFDDDVLSWTATNPVVRQATIDFSQAL